MVAADEGIIMLQSILKSYVKEEGEKQWSCMRAALNEVKQDVEKLRAELKCVACKHGNPCKQHGGAKPTLKRSAVESVDVISDSQEEDEEEDDATEPDEEFEEMVIKTPATQKYDASLMMGGLGGPATQPLSMSLSQEENPDDKINSAVRKAYMKAIKQQMFPGKTRLTAQQQKMVEEAADKKRMRIA